MKTLNKFRKRNIQTNIAHFLLVIFVVAVSVCLITGLFISHLTLKNAVDNFYVNSNLPNLWIETDLVSAEDEKFFEDFDYGKRYVFNTSFDVAGKKYDSKVLVSDGKISTPYLVEGDKGKGCYIDSKFIDKYKLGINYSIISFDYAYAGETRKLSFQVLGSMSMAEDLIVDDECVIFIDETMFVEAIKAAFPEEDHIDLNEIDYNQILISSEITNDDISSIERYYQNSTSKLIKMYGNEQIVSFKVVEEEIKISQLMLWTFPLLFITVAILVVISTISDLVSKEGYNIGLLKSLGVKNREILSNYCGYGVFMCLFGSIIGVVFSPLVVPNMTFETYDVIMNLPRDEVKMLFPFSLVAAIVLTSIIIGYFSSFFVCLNMIFKTPKDCMQRKRKIKIKSRKKSKNRFGKIGSAFKNMQINATRTAMSVVGIAGCALLGVIGFGLDFREGFIKTNKFLSLETFLNIFQVFSVVILVLTIFILSMQIFKERVREMAMLRINGESYLNVWLSMVLEILVVAIIGYLFAGALCYPILILMLKLFSVSGGVYISFAGFWKTFLMIMIFVAMVGCLAIIKIKKINLADSTKISE